MAKDYNKMTANELCQAFKEGDEFAFNALYNKYNPVVLARLNTLVKHDKGEIEDITQEIWSTAARYIKQSFKFEASFPTYLYSIVHTRCINYFRYQKHELIRLNDTEVKVFDSFLYGGNPKQNDGAASTYQANMLIDSLGDDSVMLKATVEQAAEIYYEVLAEVLKDYTQEQQVIYYHREMKQLRKASETLNRTYDSVKAESSKISQSIEDQVKEKFYGKIRNYYQD